MSHLKNVKKKEKEKMGRGKEVKMGLCANYKVIVATKYSTKHGFIARVAMVFFKLMKLTLSLTIITAAQNV